MDHALLPAPGPSSPAALVVRGIGKRFGTTLALHDVSFEAAPGEVTALLGPNGAGKTTAISCATGLLAPDDGTVHVLGEDPHRAPAAHRARVGVMIQDGGLATGATPRQLLRYAARLHTHPLDPASLSERLGIDAFSRTIVRRLSGGQRQRLALALAIIGRPQLVFLDEPTAGMDPAIRRAVRALIRELAEAGAAVLLTTHLMDDVMGLADHLVLMSRGTVLSEGTVEEVVSHHQEAGGLTLHARLRGVPAQSSGALRTELEQLAARHGAHLEMSSADATALEDVLVDLEGGLR